MQQINADITKVEESVMKDLQSKIEGIEMIHSLADWKTLDFQINEGHRELTIDSGSKIEPS